MDDPLKFEQGVTSPPITSVIEIDDDAQNLTGSTILFRLRPFGSPVFKVNASATIVDAPEGVVKYDWATNDLDTSGDYWYSWHITLPSGKVQKTPELPLIVNALVEGDGAFFGEIADRAKGYIPTSWDKLREPSFYGDRRLQRMVDLVKFKLFNTVVNATNESIYNPMVQDYAAKAVTVNLIPAAIEFWANQYQSINTQGTQESVSYPDRIRALENLHERLLAELAEDKGAIGPPLVVRHKRGLPLVDTSAIDMRTIDPTSFPRLFSTITELLWN
jgi:hypothetical protein